MSWMDKSVILSIIMAGTMLLFYSPFGDHFTQVAARLIRKITKVGFHFPS